MKALAAIVFLAWVGSAVAQQPGVHPGYYTTIEKSSGHTVDINMWDGTSDWVAKRQATGEYIVRPTVRGDRIWRGD
jgi:hypothetical protein